MKLGGLDFAQWLCSS